MRFKHLAALIVASTMVWGAFAHSTQAALTFLNNETAFTLTLAMPTSQSFDGPVTIVDENSGVVFVYGLNFSVTGTSSFDDLTIGGGDISYGVGTSSYNSILIGFTSPILSFGANFLGAATSGGTTVTTSAGDSFTVASQYPNPGSGFIGFTSTTPITSIRLTSTSGGLELADITSVVYGNPVPEPSTWALAAVGGGAFLLFRRRMPLFFAGRGKSHKS